MTEPHIRYEERVTHIGLFGLPVYEVLVIDEERDGGVFCHTEIIWGYKRACRRAYGERP